MRLPPRAAVAHQRAALVCSEPSGAPARVAFLANLNCAADLRALAPELAGWEDRRLEHLLDRLLGEARPTEVARASVVSPTGARVEVVMIALPLTSGQILTCQRGGHGAFLRSMVLDAVDLAVESGAEVIGLGGYTSIVAGAGRDVIDLLAAAKVPRVVHIGCEAASFARDIGLYLRHGYVVDKISVFDSFPLTHHTECVALLTR